MNTPALTTAVGVTLLLMLIAFMWKVLAPKPKPGSGREEITLQRFCQDLWTKEPMARWQWWVLLIIIIWKL
jgi:hypothetical protein